MTGAETAIELFHADGRPAGIWYCSECRAVQKEQRLAQSCHGVTRCEVCDVDLGKRQPHYRTKCEECDRKERRDKLAKKEFERYTNAVKIKASEYTGPQVFFNDRYYEDAREAIEDCDNPPEYIWAAKDIGLRKASTEDLIERVLENAWEDADVHDLNGVEELQKAVNAFNEANSTVSVYMVDYNEALVLDESVPEEWRAESKTSGADSGEAK